MKRIRVFPSAVQIVTFQRALDERDHGRRVFFPGCFNLRWKHDPEASALQMVQHRTFAYAVWMNRVHAADERPPLIDAAAIIP